MHERRKIEPNPNYLQDLLKKALQPNSQDLFEKISEKELDSLLEASDLLNKLSKLRDQILEPLNQLRGELENFEKINKKMIEQQTMNSIFNFIENHRESFSREELRNLIRHIDDIRDRNTQLKETLAALRKIF
jgi:Glu-tRNA(Gln) amidotransferase subunit E-like FAD-binding protein